MNSIISLDAAHQLFLDKPETVKFIDASFSMPGAGDMREKVFSQYRLPGAVFFDIDIIADQKSSLPHMLPSAALFADSVGGLGISNDDTVIVYAQGHIAMAACRVWWMFKAFGHKKVLVLDGTLRDWMDSGLPLSTEVACGEEHGDYHAELNAALVTSLADLNSDSDDLYILDARGAERFNGTAAEPRTGLQSGHIPGSVNLPFQVFFNANGTFVDFEKRRAMAQDVIDRAEKRRIVSSCGSGVTACVLSVVMDDSGFLATSVYDGSWVEYGDVLNKMPVEIAV